MRVACVGRYSETPISPYSQATPFSKLRELGLDVTKSIEDADTVVFFDFLRKDLQTLQKTESTERNSILIVMEPQVVIPQKSSKIRKYKFSKLCFLGRPPGSSEWNLNWPQPWREVIPKSSSVSMHDAVMIAGNKLSFVEGELYSFRRECAFGIKNLDVYGVGWNSRTWLRIKIFVSELLRACSAGYFPQYKSPKYWLKRLKSWKGSPGNKDAALAHYKVSLVIENSYEFLTEKLFDSFFGGCIPVYIGPDLENYQIPRELVIQVNADIDQVKIGIDTALRMDYETWRENLSKWLNLPSTKQEWMLDEIYQKIVDQINAIKAQN